MKADEEMIPKHSDAEKDRGQPKPKGGAEPPAREAQQKEVPVARERRSSHRVADDQKSGQGSLSALSKMQMLERRRAIINPRHKDPE